MVWFSNQSLHYTSFLCPQTKRVGASQRPAQHLMCSQGFLRSLTQGQQSTPGHIVDPVKHGVSLASSEMKNFEAWANCLAWKKGGRKKSLDLGSWCAGEMSFLWKPKGDWLMLYFSSVGVKNGKWKMHMKMNTWWAYIICEYIDVYINMNILYESYTIRHLMHLVLVLDCPEIPL